MQAEVLPAGGNHENNKKPAENGWFPKRETGFGPATFSLASRCTTIVVLHHLGYIHSGAHVRVRLRFPRTQLPIQNQ